MLDNFDDFDKKKKNKIELMKILDQAEEDAEQGRVTLINETFDELRKLLNDKTSM